ncbi:MAG TPA: hypothetical protein VL332_04960 [Candidatus Saccharimonadaceae bacterium]|jgi:hypothetical protein|nr:hypothetical protein [Candidatus Saccharimonadaceae bacterium]
MTPSPITRNPSAQPFSRWAISTVQGLQKLAGVGALIAAGVSIGRLVGSQWLNTFSMSDLREQLENPANIGHRATLAMVQAVICFALAALLPRAKVDTGPDGEPPRPETLDGVQRIHMTLRTTFLLWAAYYVASSICIRHSIQLPTKDAQCHPVLGPPQMTAIAQLIMDSLNALTGLSSFWLFLELSEITVPPKGVATPRDATWTARTHKLLSGGLLGLLLTMGWVGLAFVHGKTAGDSAAIATMSIMTAYLSGLSLCLVVGRLGSKLIDPGPVTLSALYIYGLIQPLAVMFPVRAEVQLLATTMALVLKLLLWLVFVWAFSTGIVGEYVKDIRDFLSDPSRQPA